MNRQMLPLIYSSGILYALKTKFANFFVSVCLSVEPTGVIGPDKVQRSKISRVLHIMLSF